ncbi:MAG TPA: histidine phosphatase family protein [Casimicrobiaceae bacterium]|nr:histidine phosphatase family protein [Casimicrobiaceae bacterium]
MSACSSIVASIAQRRLHAVAILFFALLLGVPAFALEPAQASLGGAQLLAALREGGLVIYFRHTSTDFGQNDEQMTGFEDCTHQRNLTDGGRAEARHIGAEIARLKIPVGEVLASPFCRTMETARLIFGRAEASSDVRGGPARPDSPERYDALRKLLSTRVPAGSDLVIVSHGNPFAAVAGTPYLAEGEAAVIRPLDAQGFAIVARIRKGEWETLAR